MPSRFLVLAFVCLLTFAVTAPAQATTYCASPATGCGGGDYPTLAAALGAASASTTTADDVRLGAGAYTDGPWTYIGSETNPVTIRGAGELESQLASFVTGPTLTLTYGDLENVVLYSPPEGTALRLTLGTLSKSQVVVSHLGNGVAAIGATVERSAIVPAGAAAGTTAVLADQSTVADTLISTTNGVEAVNAPVTVRRSTIVTQGYGLQSGLGETTISDSMIVLNDPTAVGVQGICDIATGTITIEATNLTVTAAVSGGVAFRSTGGQLCGGHVAVSSTLVDGVGTTANCAPGEGTASVAFSYSDSDLAGAGKVTGTCSGPVDAGGNFLADPKLANPGTLQPLPRFDSPLVDAGDPATPDLGQQPTDRAGLPRAVNERRDVGAFEYGRRAPSLSVAPEVATVATNEPVTFTATVSDPDLGDAVTLAWSFDDGGTGTGAEVTHSFAGAGSHVVTVTATDSAGVTAVRTVPVEVATPGKPDAGKPNGKPGPPVTIGLKGPKKVRRGSSAIFRFDSSKPGGTFMCRVDRKPWKSCRSPFKLKTSKLGPAKKHRFSVYAVDSAGTADATPLSRGFSIRRAATTRTS